MSKLYPESEVRKLLNEILTLSSSVDDAINSLTPIELPTDEEIYEKAKTTGGKFVNWTQYESSAFIMGSQWMRDKIKGGGE